MKYVIGKNAKYFIAIKHQSGTSYIWFHDHICMIEVRGPSHKSLDDAEKRLNDRMTSVCIQVLTHGISDDNAPKKKVRWADIDEDVL
jgi:hypothetical protein